MFVYFIRYSPWLRYILVILSCIFSVYYLSFHRRHPCCLHSKNWINILLFELVVTCIETHIFVPSFSIYHIFISIIKFLCCFSLLLGQLFNLNIPHPKTCIQHNIYTIFEQTFRFSCFIFSHTRLKRVTLTTSEYVLFSICQVKRLSKLV